MAGPTATGSYDNTALRDAMVYMYFHSSVIIVVLYRF